MDTYTDTMKLLMKRNADFKPQFDQVFDGFMNEDMITPRNETLIKIDKKLENMKDLAQAKKEGTLDVVGNAKVLPEVLDPQARV